MKKFLTLILLLNFNLNNAYSIQPDVFIQSTVNRASDILSKNVSKEEKIDGLKIIAKETVDIKGIGFYSLGSVRKVLSDKQIEKYFYLFENYFLKSFSNRLSEYTNPKIEVQNKNVINRNYTIVNSVLVGTQDRPEVKIDWRVYTKNPENPLIRDLIIEGLSLARTQKEEFSSILNSNNNNIEALFKVLNKTFISSSFEFKIDANSSFCVLAKLSPSIIKSLIKGSLGFFV